MDKNSLKETYAHHKTGKLQMNVYESSVDIPYHWHDEFEFIYVTDGICECIINGKSINVKKGQALLINGGELHTINSFNTGNFFAVVFHPFLFGTEFSNFFSKMISYKRIYDKNNLTEKRIISTLKHIHTYFYKRYFGYELILKALIIEIFGVIYENMLYTIKEKNEIHTSDAFADIVEYIHNHFAEKISLDDVAKYANYSKSYLIRLFKKNTGKTYSSYLNGYRIHKAINMLETTDKSILEISEACGFGNVAYFIKVFKQNIGTTPHKYRMQHPNGI